MRWKVVLPLSPFHVTMRNPILTGRLGGGILCAEKVESSNQRGISRVSFPPNQRMQRPDDVD